MNITKLKLENFRNYDSQEIEFNKGINVIYGDNAQGKTNIIEAIFLCSMGKSFRAKQDKEMIKLNENNSIVEIEFFKSDRDGKIKIEYEGETEISYLTYRWDDQDENKIDINSKTIDKEIDTLNGKHTLTIIVVDVNNHTETKVQQTNGVSIPTIDIRFNEDKTSYIINVKDDVELKEVIITLDEDDSKKYGQKINGKEFQFEIALKEGSDNKMKVQVTNSDDQTAEKAVMFSK